MSKKILIVMAAFFTAGSAFSQLTDTVAQPKKAVTLDEVIVTANKLPQKQSTTGKVISVITKEEIEKSSGKTVGELLNEQTGLTINGALNNLGANQTIYLRGAASGRTLILMDGIPVYDPSNINNEFDINLLSLNNIESIEICRGSQSTLYGSDAIAGVINIITTSIENKKPINLKATVSAGNYGTFRTNGQVFGSVDKLSYALKYGRLSSKGFSAAYDSTGNKNFANNKYAGDVASASLQYRFTNSFSFRSFVQNSSYKTDLDNAAFADEKDYTVSNKSLIAGMGAHFQQANVSVTANYQYNKTKRYYFNDSIDIPSFVKFSTDNYVGETQFAEIFSSIKLSELFTIVEGGDHRFSSFHNAYISISSFGPYNSKFNDTSLSQSSLYGSLLFHDAGSKLNVELGGRLNVHSRYGSNYTYTFNPSYKINNEIRVFGSLESGFKAPSLYQLYSAYGNPSLKPEKSKTIEGGLQLTCNTLSARAVYFHRDINDGLDFDYNNFTYYNFTHQKTNGLELELQYKPVKGFDVTANYTYIKPTEQSQSHLTFSDTTYSYLLRRPAHNLNVKVGYQSGSLYVSATGKYVGARYDAAGYQKADILLNSYFILGGYAEYKFTKNVKVFADAQNIGNKKFFDIRGYNSIPFLINAGVSISL